MFTALSLIPLLLAARTPSPDVAAGSNDPPPKIAGEWKLDPILSESLEQKMRERMNRGGPMGGGGFGGRRPGGMGGGGFGGRGGRGGGGRPEGGVTEEERDPRGRAGMMDAVRPPVQLSITQADSAVTMAADLGPPHLLYLDGRASVDTLGDMSIRKSSARIKKGKLEVERKVGELSKLTEKYSYDEEHKLLVVEVRLEGPRGTIELHRFYQPVKPSGD